MTAILGSTEQMEDIRDGTLCRQKSPRPGPAGQDSKATPHLTNLTVSRRIKAVREKQQSIQVKIEKIQDAMDSAKDGALDERFWSAVGVSSFQDLKATFSTQWENLRSDVQALHNSLRDMGVKAREHFAEARAALTCAATDQNLASLLLEAEKNGEIDPSELGVLQGACERSIQCWTDAVAANPTEGIIRALVSQLAVACQLGLGEKSDAVRAATATLRDTATALARDAEKRFRDNPTSANFGEYCRAAAFSLIVDGEGPSEMPTALPRLRPEKSYVTKAGDSLPAISRMFYGTPSYWDFIYMENRKEIGADPDRLAAGMNLRIP